MSAPSTLVPTEDRNGTRLDVYLAGEIVELSRVRARGLIIAGNVRVDGKAVRPSFRVESGQSITVELPEPAPSGLIPEPMDLRVIYEDVDVAVIDKPAGLVVHPAPGHAEHTLVHGLLSRLQGLGGIGGTLRPGIVHRLDRDTSGLLAVAKTERGQAALSAQFAARSVKKGYLTLVSGHPRSDRGLIDAAIGRDREHRQRMSLTPRGRPAATRYLALAALDRWTFLLAMPLTGRTHQIRLHLAGLGCPVAGDKLYGGSAEIVPRQFLHAAFLRFTRPADGCPIELSSPLPPDLRLPLQRLAGFGMRSPSPVREVDQLVELAWNHFHNDEIGIAGTNNPTGALRSI